MLGASPMKIIIVDDHPLIRDAVRRACVEECGHTVVGEAQNGATTLELARLRRPDLIILDIGLPDMDGFEVAAIIRRELPKTRFLILTASLDEYTIFRVGKFGFQGFLDKGSNAVTHLRTALDQIAAGNCFFSPAYHDVRAAMRTNSYSFEKILTRCEQEILSLVGEGLSDQEIGTRLGISPSTSQTHRSNILQKLNIRGTPKLVAYAIKNGFTRIPSHTPFAQ